VIFSFGSFDRRLFSIRSRICAQIFNSESDEQVQGVVNRPFHGILDRDDTIIGAASRNLVEDVANVSLSRVIDRCSEFRARSLV